MAASSDPVTHRLLAPMAATVSSVAVAEGDEVRSGQEVVVLEVMKMEHPLAIHLDGTLVATTMRTPGHDFELAVGFCHAEGLLHGVAVRGVRYCATGSAVDTEFNVVTVETGGRAPAPRPRLGTVGSSCTWASWVTLQRYRPITTACRCFSAYRNLGILSVCRILRMPRRRGPPRWPIRGRRRRRDGSPCRDSRGSSDRRSSRAWPTSTPATSRAT